MKTLIALCAIVLCIASLGTWLAMPDLRSDRPVLYWVTDNNPARVEQVRRFQAWLARTGGPSFELRLDTSNAEQYKKIIQGVSGVAADIMDVPGFDLDYYHAIGLLDDVTDAGRAMGFSPDQTFAFIGAHLAVEGRQYLFPCNVSAALYYVNKATFRKYGLPLPPRRWTIEEFETHGRRFVAAANPPGQRPRIFFLDMVDRESLRRSLGLSMFNETLTRCVLDDPRNLRSMELLRRWTFEDRLIPSEADRQSFTTATGYGGSGAQLFNSGQVAMLNEGRHMLIQFRKFARPLELGISEFPHGGFPTIVGSTRAAGIYAGSQHKDLARYFLAFLASEDYNSHVVDDADALPPVPAFTRTDAYRRPPQYPNEWECHEAFAQAAQTIALPIITSPFVLYPVALRIDQGMFNLYMNGLATAADAAAQTQARINDEIDRTLREQPELRPLYETRLKEQEQIDALRRAGRKVPLNLIHNPFHQRYYQHMGWAQENP